MHPRHLIFATGVSSIPSTPDLPGLADFAGVKVHSGDLKNAAQWKDRKALVLGSGTSGHDVAQELAAHGAAVTIIQRSQTYVVSLKEAQSVYAIYSEGIPFDDCDLLATSFPYPVLQRAYQLSTAKGIRVDRKLIAALDRRGFKTMDGRGRDRLPDDVSAPRRRLLFQCRLFGFDYFRCGSSCCNFPTSTVSSAQGARLKDGSVVPAELLVLATGYKNQQEAVRAYLGDEIADKIGPVWGFDEGGELRNMWRQTAQLGLWFTAGSLAQCRIFSRYLAIQIKALEGRIAELAPCGRRTGHLLRQPNLRRKIEELADETGGDFFSGRRRYFASCRHRHRHLG